MPSGKTHREFARWFGVRDSRAVDRLIDSTASAHGPAHRSDPIHTLPGVLQALASRGELNSQTAAAAVLHFAADGLFDRMLAVTRLRGEPRKAAKILLENQVRAVLQRRRRR